MRLLRDQPIERKLLLLVTLTSAVALALAAVGLLIYQWSWIAEDARHDARTKAEIVAGNLSAAVQTGDTASATNVLQALKSQPQFKDVAGYATDGNVVAALTGSPLLPRGLVESVHFQDGSAFVYRLVQTKGGRFSVVYVQCAVQPSYGRLAWFFLVLLGVFAVALAAAVALSVVLRRSIASPVQALPQTTTQTAAEAPRALPETKEGANELAESVAGLKGMLSQLKNREAGLQRTQIDLESHIAERTRALQEQIAQRQKAEAALADEKERLAVTLRSIGDAVVATDRRGDIVLFNTIAEELTGWKTLEALGRPLREVLRICNAETRQPCEDPVQLVLKTESTVELSANTLLIARNGAERLIADSGAPIRDREGKSIGVVLVFRDVTEKQRLADELLKASKLESIGLMAGGIAHDFNNVLTAILGSVSLAKLQAPPEGDLAKALQTAERAANRARDLTRQLLAFAKGGAPVRKPAPLLDLIKENAEFVLHGSSVRCLFSLPNDLWPAEVDAGQLNQVIQNLALFGVRAMPGGGSLEVRAANVTLSEPSWVPLPAGRYVMISFQDHGQGITPEDLPRIFDPYFVTKESGRGLGLAAAYSIVKRHDGHIAVESMVGRGTTFHVYLPAVTVPKPVPAGRPALNGDRTRILVMDDDPAVRDVAEAILDSLGYDVTLTEEGGKAIESYREALSDGRPFAAVILDLTVQGGKGGEETIRELLRLDKNVKAVVSSGYYDDPVVARHREYGFCGSVPKPYTLEELGRTLKEILDAPRKETSPRA